MSARAKREYVQAIYQRYRQARRPEKRQILNEFCQVAGYHRKPAIRLLNRAAPGAAAPPRRRARTYSPAVIEALRTIWEGAGYPWSVRLKALLPLWLPWARRRERLPPAVAQQFLGISPRQMDRRLAPYRDALTKRLYGRTKPGTLLKHHIPIKTDRWNVATPGFTEIDLVAHSGSLGDGEFLHSLNLTDIHATWVDTAAVLGKGQAAVQAALEELRQALPFRLRGIDSDNGSEFIISTCGITARPGRSSSRAAARTRKTTTPISSRRTGFTSASCSAMCAMTARPRRPPSTPCTATSSDSWPVTAIATRIQHNPLHGEIDTAKPEPSCGARWPGTGARGLNCRGRSALAACARPRRRGANDGRAAGPDVSCAISPGGLIAGDRR